MGYVNRRKRENARQYNEYVKVHTDYSINDTHRDYLIANLQADVERSQLVSHTSPPTTLACASSINDIFHNWSTTVGRPSRSGL